MNSKQSQNDIKLPIAKDKFAVVKKILDRRYSAVSDLMPTFHGVSIDEFEKEDIIKICSLFWNCFSKEQQKYLALVQNL